MFDWVVLRGCLMSCINMFKNKRISSVDGDKDKKQFHKFLTNYVPVNRFDFINFDFKVTRLNDFLKIYTINCEKSPDTSLHFHLFTEISMWTKIIWRTIFVPLYWKHYICVIMKWLHWEITPNHLKSPRKYIKQTAQDGLGVEEVILLVAKGQHFK